MPQSTLQPVNISVVALNQTPLDWDKNIAHHLEALKEARKQDAFFVLFPELSIPGYGCEDWFLSSDVLHRSFQGLLKIAAHTQGMCVAVGLPIDFRGYHFNAQCIIADGTIRGFVPKQNLANDSIYYENRWFKRWEAGYHSEVTYDGVSYPIGDLLFEIDGYRLGIEICEDAWVPHRPATRFSGMGVNIILNPSMSHFAQGRHTQRKVLVTESSRAFSCVYAYANSLGLHSGRIMLDGGCFIANCGKLKAESTRFSFQDFTLTTATVELQDSMRCHAAIASAEPQFNETSRIVYLNDLQLPTPHTPALPKNPENWETGAFLRENELARTLGLSLFDYMRKSRQQKFIVSLSGGQDSTTVALAVRLMVALSCRELGLEDTKSRLGLWGSASEAASEEELMKELLVCVYQRSPHSSSHTENSARDLAKELGAQFYLWDIGEIVDLYETKVSEALGLTLDWDSHDIARQNIQARVRSPGIWMVANLLGGLLLTTSNRSEASIGYATMDGDTSGGWNPIGGIEKAYISTWLEWMLDKGIEGLSLSIDSVRSVLSQPPTAELREGGTQTDEDDLMPYPVLDAIERAAITEKLAPLDVFHRTYPLFAEHHDKALYIGWVKKFFRLWSINQWKRERFAPSVLVDNQNLDPKTACRFPILSGSFKKELEELDLLL